MKNKVSILIRAIVGQLIQIWYSIVEFNGNNCLNTDKRAIPIVVSLTSYGRRVRKTLPFTLISLLRQKCKPDKITVWLDYVCWNENNLPLMLRKLKKYGIEYHFCEDIRSYKKLIPALLEYPDAIVITVDDDVYYRSTLILDLYASYLNQPQAIHATVAYQPVRNVNGELIEYDRWLQAYERAYNAELFPTGVGGCLYPPQSLNEDVLKKDIFLKLSPTADDIWFWVMAKMNSTGHVLVQTKKFFIMDLLYELTHKGSSLRHENVHAGSNDIQLKQVLDYYGLK